MTWFSPPSFFWLPQNTLYLVSVGKNELISSSVNRFQLQSRLFSAVQPVKPKIVKALREQSKEVNFGLLKISMNEVEKLKKRKILYDN